MLYEILYSSVSSRHLSREELQELSEQAQKNNRNIGVTGCLVYHSREFIQLLEGDATAVKQMFETIASDNRHSNLQVIWKGQIAHRAFESWAMAYVNLEEQDYAANPSLHDLIADGLNTAVSTGHETTARQLIKIIRDDLL